MKIPNYILILGRGIIYEVLDVLSRIKHYYFGGKGDWNYCNRGVKTVKF